MDHHAQDRHWYIGVSLPLQNDRPRVQKGMVLRHQHRLQTLPIPSVLPLPPLPFLGLHQLLLLVSNALVNPFNFLRLHYLLGLL